MQNSVLKKVLLIVFCSLLIMNMFRFIYSSESLFQSILFDDFLRFLSSAPDSSQILDSMLSKLNDTFTTGNSTLDSLLIVIKLPIQLLMMIVTGLIQIGMYISYIFNYIINF